MPPKMGYSHHGTAVGQPTTSRMGPGGHNKGGPMGQPKGSKLNHQMKPRFGTQGQEKATDAQRAAARPTNARR